MPEHPLRRGMQPGGTVQVPDGALSVDSSTHRTLSALDVGLQLLF